MGAGPTRALTGGRRTKPTSTGCRRLRQPEPGRRSTYQAGEPVQTNRASSDLQPFEGASNRTAVLVLRKGAATSYPLDYTLWRRTAAGRIASDASLEDVM